MFTKNATFSNLLTTLILTLILVVLVESRLKMSKGRCILARTGGNGDACEDVYTYVCLPEMETGSNCDGHRVSCDEACAGAVCGSCVTETMPCFQAPCPIAYSCSGDAAAKRASCSSLTSKRSCATDPNCSWQKGQW